MLTNAIRLSPAAPGKDRCRARRPDLSSTDSAAPIQDWPPRKLKRSSRPVPRHRTRSTPSQPRRRTFVRCRFGKLAAPRQKTRRADIEAMGAIVKHLAQVHAALMPPEAAAIVRHNPRVKQ